MKILGTSFYYHDAAAALLVDGKLVAAAEEERFNRKKHSSDFPENAIRYCLEAGNLNPTDLDAITFYEKPLVKFDRILQSTLATWPRGLETFVRAMPVWLTRNLKIDKQLSEALPGFSGDIVYCPHHVSHAASAFLASPFEEAAILVADGVGEWATTSIGRGKGGQVTLAKEIRFPHSLGLLYSAITAYLGFRVNDAEWKVMGLAPYGQPRYLEQLRDLVFVAPDGSFRLNMRYFDHHWNHRRIANDRLAKLLGRPQRPSGAPLEEFHNDVARSVQALLEEILLVIGKDLRVRTGSENLCLAGGVALNSVANRRLLTETGFQRIFVQPAAGDAGGALGCALYAYNTVFEKPRAFVMERADWGPIFEDGAISRALERLGVTYERLGDEALIARTAELVLASKVVGWFQGRMEFGPRALGNRSILGNATDPQMKDILNAKIKYREAFRPFAPSVLAEAAPDYFEMDGIPDSPFMTLVIPVRAASKARIPAVTHADGTGRVQTVTEKINPRFYKLIRRIGEMSGVPIVVNTSFNIRGEPIVCTPEEAVRCFERTGMDALVAGNCLVTKKRQAADLAKGWKESDRLEAGKAPRGNHFCV